MSMYKAFQKLQFLDAVLISQTEASSATERLSSESTAVVYVASAENNYFHELQSK